MSFKVKLKRGNTSAIKGYAAEDYEVVYDTDKGMVCIWDPIRKEWIESGINSDTFDIERDNRKTIIKTQKEELDGEEL